MYLRVEIDIFDVWATSLLFTIAGRRLSLGLRARVFGLILFPSNLISAAWSPPETFTQHVPYDFGGDRLVLHPGQIKSKNVKAFLSTPNHRLETVDTRDRLPGSSMTLPCHLGTTVMQSLLRWVDEQDPSVASQALTIDRLQATNPHVLIKPTLINMIECLAMASLLGIKAGVRVDVLRD